jgi:hypothetical protein
MAHIPTISVRGQSQMDEGAGKGRGFIAGVPRGDGWHAMRTAQACFPDNATRARAGRVIDVFLKA